MALSGDVVNVAVGVVLQGDQVLVARRPDFAYIDAEWEFPGGKVEAGESPFEALVREFDEELGIEVVGAKPLICVEHCYFGKSFRLHAWLVDSFSGVVQGMEQQDLQWVGLDVLESMAFPAGNRPIIAALLLPEVYVVSGAWKGEVEGYLSVLEDVLAQGVRLVQLRVPGVVGDLFVEVVRQAGVLCEAFGAELLVNCDDFSVVSELNVSGWHMRSEQLLGYDVKAGRPVGCRWWAASCHNLVELERAVELGVDFVTLSPVLETVCHPEAVPLGWSEFEVLCRQARVPVFALGGLSLGDVEKAVSFGAKGVAGISGFWG